MGKTKRPTDAARLFLWVRSGGRCAICNEYLLRDYFTSQEAVLGDVAHIIALGKKGPRNLKEIGSVEPDFDLNDPDNLVLLCKTHHWIVDHEAKDQYPRSRLIEIKSKHEKQIEWQTSFDREKRLKVLVFTSNIKGEDSKVTDADIQKALDPYYADGKIHKIDCNQLLTVLDEAAWTTYAKQIEEKIKAEFRPEVQEKDVESIGVFGIGPIPLLFKLGSCLSDKIRTHYYQRHRETEDWVWQECDAPVRFEINKLVEGDDIKNVGLILSLSGQIELEKVRQALDKNMTIYEIRPSNETPSRTLVKDRRTLENFGAIYRDFFDLIQNLGAKPENLHVFPATPVSVSIYCGQHWIKKADPNLLIYDFDNNQFKFTMRLKNE